VPRLGAVVARHAGDPGRAARLLDHVMSLCEHEDLPAERAKALLELARCEAAAGAPTADVAALFVEAVRAFDELSLHGWVARADEVAQQVGFSVVAAHGAARERAIYTDDVVGSTESNARLGDAVYLEQLRIHDRLVRGRLRECAGLEIKHTGDGLNAVFLHRADAVRCALAAQADIDAWHRSEPGLALQIRSGLAYGPVIPSGGDFFGLVQAQAARLSALAGPGEVLATAEVVTGLAAGTVKTASIGYHGLKGLPAPIEVFRLTAS
jgi:class 3 adenylate cyclase